MNLDMLQRIKDEGARLCGNDGALKGVTWAYNATPDGVLAVQLAVQLASPSSPPPGFVPDHPTTHEQVEVGNAMDRLAASAPKPYQYDEDIGRENSTYICTDGSEYSSVKFEFVPQ
jgi:hypothetical protein